MSAPQKALPLACLSFLLLAGCASHHYGLRPIQGPSQVYQICEGQAEIITSPGRSTTIRAFADVREILSSTYILAFAHVTNCSVNTIDVSPSFFELLARSPKGERRAPPIESEALVKKLSKQRASRQTGRALGTLFAAMASGHQSGTYTGVASDGTPYSGTYSTTDTGEQLRVLGTGMAANKIQSDQESQLVRDIDRYLLRPTQLAPTQTIAGLLLFPFRESQSYKLRATCGGDTHEFIYQLRDY